MTTEHNAKEAKQFDIHVVTKRCIGFGVLPFLTFFFFEIFTRVTLPSRLLPISVLWTCLVCLFLSFMQIIHKEISISIYPSQISFKGKVAVTLSVFQIIIFVPLAIVMIKTIICNC